MLGTGDQDVPPGPKGSGGVQAPLANFWAFWWSLSSTSSASASPTRAAAASTPAWRIPPPRAFRRRQASSMKCLGPPTRAPTGAPRPWGCAESGHLPGGAEGTGRGRGDREGQTLRAHQGRGWREPGPTAASTGARGPNSASSCRHAHPPVSGAARHLPYLGEAERHRVTVLRDAGGGHAQSHCGVHQPGPVQVDPDPVGPGQQVHLGARRRQRLEGPGWGRTGGRVGLRKVTRGHWAWLLEEAQGV